MILCSGFNVYPREVDEVLFAHPLFLKHAQSVCLTPNEVKR